MDRVHRRDFLVAAGTFLAAPLVAEAQQAANVTRIGYLSHNLAASSHLRDAFLQGLRELGYVEGRNVVIEYRYAEGKPERLPALAAELVALKVDVMVTVSNTTALAAKQATRTVPIVFTAVANPVAAGIVTSLARPGGNLTGLASLGSELVGKRLELVSRPFRGSVGSLSSGCQVPSANGRRKTCGREQTLRHGRWGCGFNSLRREVPPISTGLSRT